MRRFLLALAALAALAAAVWAALVPASPAGDPHPFMADQAKCDLCHKVVWKGSVGDLDNASFPQPFIKMCNACHGTRIGRSHPVGMSPYRAVPRDRYPDVLPLQWSEEQSQEIMTCVTCHDLHAGRFAEQKLYSRQEPHPQGGGYLTYYLRVRPESPRDGFAPLCKTCHPRL